MALLGVVFLFAYGVATHSLLYPHSDDYWWDILYNIFYQPYLSFLQQYGVYLFHSRCCVSVQRRGYRFPLYRPRPEVSDLCKTDDILPH